MGNGRYKALYYIRDNRTAWDALMRLLGRPGGIRVLHVVWHTSQAHWVLPLLHRHEWL